jgi:hypothetical protein
LLQQRAELRDPSWATPYFQLMGMAVPAGAVDRLVIAIAEEHLLLLDRTAGIQIPKSVFRQSKCPAPIAMPITAAPY